MLDRIRGISAPVIIAATILLAVVIGAAVALALDSDDDAPDMPDPTPTATMPAATPTPTTPPPSPTATEQAATPVPATATVATSETWSIEYRRTGGFAGVAQNLSVSSDGQARYEDERADRVVNGTLSASQLDELRALIDSTDFFSQTTPQEAPCADCFNLSITVTLDGATHAVDAVDIGVDATLKPLVDRLSALLQDGLTQ